MTCRADVHYTIHRGGWHGDGDITHLSCCFCDRFSVYKGEPGMKRGSADLGFYNRMRAKMVKHLHDEHREQLEATKDRRGSYLS